MNFDGRLEIKSTELLLKERGLQNMGKVQAFIDSECIRLMKPYTPFRSGMLERAVTIGTVIGSGELHQNTPYARYLYYGVVYGPNIPIYENNILVGFRSPPKKHSIGREIKYDKSAHPQAGKMWFERMKSDHMQDILDGAQKIASGG